MFVVGGCWWATPFPSNMYTPRRNGLGKLPAVGYGFVGIFVQFQGCNLHIEMQHVQTKHFLFLKKISSVRIAHAC